MSIVTDLPSAMPDVARALYGEPVPQLSTAQVWRYGRRGSLAIDVDRGIWRDHEAGTGGGVLALIVRAKGGDACSARRWLGVAALGYASTLDGPEFSDTRAPARGTLRVNPALSLADREQRTANALRIWQSAHPPHGSPVEAYLASRGLPSILANPLLAPALRFAPACPFGSGSRRPAMIGLLTACLTGKPMAIRRTALDMRGGRARDDDGTKLPHKALGPSAGAIVRLCGGSTPPARLALCEGLETGLSLLCMTGAPIWACLSAGMLASFPVLPGVERLAIYADHDPPGLHAARTLARRWQAAGRAVEVIYPPRDGADFNDLLMEASNG